MTRREHRNFQRAAASLIELVQQRGRPAAVALLAEFNVDRLTLLPAEKLPEFTERARAAIAKGR